MKVEENLYVALSQIKARIDLSYSKHIKLVILIRQNNYKGLLLMTYM